MGRTLRFWVLRLRRGGLWERGSARAKRESLTHTLPFLSSFCEKDPFSYFLGGAISPILT